MKTHYKVFLALFVLTAAFLSGTWYASRNSAGGAAPAARKILRYICPMHPQYVSDHPGECPSCGMRLEPVYSNGSGDEAGAEARMPAGTVQIDPERQQLIGLRIGRAEVTSGARTIRILGRVAPDETRIYRLTASVDGWIVEAMPNTVGSLVKKNEILASFYSPEFLGSEQAYIYALNSLARFQASGNETNQQIQLTKANLQQYTDTLRNQGMSDLQIEEIGSERKLTQKIYIVAPSAGFVLLREVSPGLRFVRGTELYRIADLRRVWILADLFEKEAEFVRPGLKAEVRSSQNPARVFQARVSNVLPQFDPATRTLKARLEVDNPDFVLRPEMFVDVEFPVDLPPSLAVPVDAVIDTGLRKTVFIDRGNGYFEPRPVETGWRFGSQIEIVKGLMEGERLVVSSTFLVDSESRMKAAAAGIFGTPRKDPVCGMDVDESRAKAAGRTSEFRGEIYYFCSDKCKEDFDKAPGKYASMPPAAGAARGKAMPDMQKDPVCGMDVRANEAKATGRTSVYKGTVYYFCSDACKQDFDKNPEKHLKKDPVIAGRQRP